MLNSRQTEVNDKTGREILEGDVCEFTQGVSGSRKGTCEIVFRRGSFYGLQKMEGQPQVSDDLNHEHLVPFSDASPAYRPENHFTIISR